MKVLVAAVVLACITVISVAVRHVSQTDPGESTEVSTTITVSDALSTTTVQAIFTTAGSSLEECTDTYEKLLAAPAQFFGPVEKQGVVPLTYWYPKYLPALTDKFVKWQLDAMVYFKPDALAAGPPLSASCSVLVNHNYKFIFIKNTKTAGTTLFKFFGMYCFEQGQARKPTCLDRVVLERIPTEDLALQMWKDYFVFTVSRNPYNRAGSAYDYMLGRRTVSRTGICADPPFVDFCKDPTVVGRQNKVMRCLNDDLHDFYHVEPISRCVMSTEGLSAVDFVIRYEKLEEDFMQAVGIINQRRDPGLPAITGTLGWDQKGPLTDGSTSTASLHAAKYANCGADCIANTANFYWDEVKLFGYPTCVKNSTA